MIEKLKISIKSFIYDFIYIPIYFNIVYFRDLHKIKKQYGDFERLNRIDKKNYTLYYGGKIKNVTGLLYAEIVKIINDLNFLPKRVLLDGDNKLIINQFKENFNFNFTEVLTAGIGNDFDFNWNFENNPPENLPNDFDIIISQAMFEHLIDPYKHLVDLTGRLKYGGIIIIHTVMPGYTYHRYPIDTLRFFPDWFETSANRLKLSIIRRFQRDFHIFYVLKKERPY